MFGFKSKLRKENERLSAKIRKLESDLMAEKNALDCSKHSFNILMEEYADIIEKLNAEMQKELDKFRRYRDPKTGRFVKHPIPANNKEF